MGIKLKRKKQRILLNSIFYRLIKLPVSDLTKLKLFLNLEWIFDRLSLEVSNKIYTFSENPLKQSAFEFIADCLKPEHKVLDLGCATGEIASKLAEKVEFVVGIDHSKTLINLAQSRFKASNLEFICEDALVFLNSSSKQFDVLFLSHILEHIDSPEVFLQKFVSHFSFVYIEVPDFDRSAMNHYRQRLNIPLIYSDEDHVSEFDRDELSELVTNCGLKIIKTQFKFGVIRYWCEVIK